VAGHEFHRTVTRIGDGTAAWGWRDNAGHPVTEGLVRRGIHASYLHVHWAGHPHLAARFVGCAAEVGR
jgi:cobyrinic acid a,c-diamide synthase